MSTSPSLDFGNTIQRPATNMLRNHSRTDFTIFLVLWSIFTILTFVVIAMNVPHGLDNFGEVFLATIGTLAGPMPGALSRGSQSCRLKFSLGLLPYAGAALPVAVIPQFVGIHRARRVSPLMGMAKAQSAARSREAVAWFQRGQG